MKLKLFACLVVGALVSVTPAVADPSFEPFLAVDLNGYVNSDGLQLPGPTEAGFQAWDIEDSLFAPWTNSTNAAGISQVFPTSMGNVTAMLIGHTAGTRAARNRGDGDNMPFDEARQDWPFISRVENGFGQYWYELKLSGLTPGKIYEFTGWAQDQFNGAFDSYQAWADLDKLDGNAGPGAWLDAE